MTVVTGSTPSSTAQAPQDPVVQALTGSYSAEVLRRQMTLLRSESETRARLEKEIHAEHTAAAEKIRREAETARKAIVDRHRRESAEAKAEYDEIIQRTEAKLESEQRKLDEQRSTRQEAIKRTAATAKQKLRDEEEFEINSIREVQQDKRRDPLRQYTRARGDLARSRDGILATEAEVRRYLALRKVTLASVVPAPGDAPATGSAPPTGAAPPADAAAPTGDASAGDAAPTADSGPEANGTTTAPAPPPRATSTPATDPFEDFETLRAEVTRSAQDIVQLPDVADAFSESRQAAAILVPVLIALGCGLAGFIFTPGQLPEALGFRAAVAAGIAGVIVPVGILIGLRHVSRVRAAARCTLARHGEAVCRDVARCLALIPACDAHLATRRDEQVARLERLHQAELGIRKKALAEQLTSLSTNRDRELADLESKYQTATESLRWKATATREAADKKYPARLAALDTSRDEDLLTLTHRRDEDLAAVDRRRTERWTAMTDQWRSARETAAAVYDSANRVDAAAFPPWEEIARDDVPLPTVPPPGLRFGTLALSLERVPGGISAEPALNAFGPLAWTQPATVAYPTQASILIKTTVEQKETSSALMQALMLRIAAGIPPGQSRFMIVDPLGLGKQFAGFMHLVDYDELLVTSRIWTEPSLIEQKLADITDQMEVVIQKYLRNEYASIGDYNADAEVPEPYKFVVVANFPANFTETSARRLASIAASGPRCGVYVIVSVDTRQMLPAGFSLADLEQHATTIVLKNGVFTWEDPEFGKWPLTVERAPSDEICTRIIQRVGRAAKAAKRVEVPFDRVAPKPEEWWQGSTASEVVAPLGPAGARKLQYLRLGRGTSQHALIAGKTGSGKSTLMHAMITSLALQYSPKEIQFYLIDFKKGVEFKLYDHYRLPHARVIAIESEREFGLSVLQQLDAELKRRGDLFRELSVQDVASFRRTGHADPMPRILLLIDEFQEMFVEDDKLAQDSSLILDRLVRQGRAFGMHVLLGSQTLGGSYSLPRATMGQMAVRIALQCNEADSSLILSEDNTAARLLTRPGEAIYNDANGMIDGNSPFQVVFLNDERRERYLGALRALADRREDIPKLPRIVFDGNEAANPAENRLLAELLQSGTVHGRVPPAPLAWLGDAIAIKDPTAAIFRRQGGANLLMVGQREDLGACLLAMSLVSLAICHDPHPGGALKRPGRFVLLEPAIAEEKPDLLLAKIAQRLPHDVECVSRLGVGTAITALAAEVQRRLDEQILDAESVFVVIRDLARYRELRRSDGDFGFSFGSDQKIGPAQHFLTILRDGPAVGIHALVWCDSLTNLQRTFERNTIKDFELRVLFQMSSADSSQLIDSPLANKLGPQRALFIHEESGALEKFRPYAFPTADWLAGIEARLRARPQGTPAERPAPPPPPPAPPTTESFGLPGGFGDFNFTKFLDDAPTEGDQPPAGP